MLAFLCCLRRILHVIIFSTVCCLLVAGKVPNVKKCGISTAVERIVGGSATKHGQYPWMVSIHYRYTYTGLDHLCGGAILNSRWILTAAHCIVKEAKPEHYEIHAGLHRISQKNSLTWKKYKVSKIIAHEGYNQELHFLNDIALISTKTPINFGRSGGYITPICLPETTRDPTGWATVTGWGHTKHEGVASDILKEVEVPLVPRQRCNAYFRPKSGEHVAIKHSMLCAGRVNKDACQSDSGGPLMQKDDNGVFTLIGIVSFGKGCGSHIPGVYTKVGSYLGWLEKHMVGRAGSIKG